MGKIQMKTKIENFKNAGNRYCWPLCRSGSFTPSRALRKNRMCAVVQQVFQQLQSRDYGAVYDSLPSSSRNANVARSFHQAP